MEFSIINHTSTDLTIDASLFECQCNGVVNWSYEAEAVAGVNANVLRGVIKPDEELRGSVFYEIPKNIKEVKIIFMPDGPQGDIYSFFAYPNN